MALNNDFNCPYSFLENALALLYEILQKCLKNRITFFIELHKAEVEPRKSHLCALRNSSLLCDVMCGPAYKPAI